MIMAQKSDIDLQGDPKQAKFFFHKLTLKSTELTIKAAAEERQDDEVLRDIRDADLLAKEFQVHDKCRLEYTRKRMSVEGKGSNEPAGNLKLVKEFIKSSIIEGNQAVSMAVVHEMYEDGHSQVT